MLNPRFLASGTGSSAMMDGELKKTSVRANRLEKKRFEMMLSAYDSAKRNVAMEMKRSQVDVKRRLKRYKDRQREIHVTKPKPTSTTNADDYMLKQIRRLSQATGGGGHHHHHHTDRSSVVQLTDQNSAAAATDHLPTSTTTSTTSTSTLGSVTLPALSEVDDDDDDEAEEEDKGDPLALTHVQQRSHQQRSKADLRPYVAWSLHSTGSPDLAPPSSSSSSSPPSRPVSLSSVQLLQLRGGRLGTPSRQVHFLDEEEIEQRCSFHRLLLSRYRHLENRRLQRINDLVGVFCGKATITNTTTTNTTTTTNNTTSTNSITSGSRPPASCPPIPDEGVVTLPPGVPASVHRAMRVKMFPLNSLEQWAKGNAASSSSSSFPHGSNNS